MTTEGVARTDETSRVAQIEERLAKATPGPWRKIGMQDTGKRGMPHWGVTSILDGDYYADIAYAQVSYDGYGNGSREQDADLIANAPADLAWLLAELAKAQQENERLSEHIETVERDKVADLFRKIGVLRAKVKEQYDENVRLSDLYDSMCVAAAAYRTDAETDRNEIMDTADPAYTDWATIVALARQARMRWKWTSTPRQRFVNEILGAIENLDRRLRETLEDAVAPDRNPDGSEYEGGYTSRRGDPAAEDEQRFLNSAYDEEDNL